MEIRLEIRLQTRTGACCVANRANREEAWRRGGATVSTQADVVDFVYLLVARYFLFITWFAPVAAFSLRRAACIMVCIYSHNVDRLWSRSRVSRGEGFI